jgi:hypothetical protein
MERESATDEVFLQDEPGESQQSKLSRIRSSGFFDKGQNLEALEACDNNVDRAVNQLLRNRFRKTNQPALGKIARPISEMSAPRRSMDSAHANAKHSIPFYIPRPVTKKDLLSTKPDNIFDDDSMISRNKGSSRRKEKGKGSSYVYYVQLHELHRKGFLNTKVNKQILEECFGDMAKSLMLLDRYGYKPDLKGKKIIVEQESESSFEEDASYSFPKESGSGFFSSILNWKQKPICKESAQLISINNILTQSRSDSLERKRKEDVETASHRKSSSSSNEPKPPKKKTSFQDDPVTIPRSKSYDDENQRKPNSSSVYSQSSFRLDENQRKDSMKSPPSTSKSEEYPSKPFELIEEEEGSAESKN